MILKHLFASFFAMLALSLTLAACSSDDNNTPNRGDAEKQDSIAVIDSIPDEFTGKWDFDGFTLSLANEVGTITYSTKPSEELNFKVFYYDYKAEENTLVCICEDETKFTLKNFHLENGNLSITHTLMGAEKTETGVKHDEGVDYIPDAFVGTWDFDGFQLNLEKNTYGLVTYTNSDNYFGFTYGYREDTNILYCNTFSILHYTIKDIHLDADGNLVITHNFNDNDVTVTGTKHTFATVTKEQLMGKWISSDNDEVLNFKENEAVIYEDESGTWRIDGCNVYVTINGKEKDYVRNIEVSGNTLKANIYLMGYWRPYTLTRVD